MNQGYNQLKSRGHRTVTCALKRFLLSFETQKFFSRLTLKNSTMVKYLNSDQVTHETLFLILDSQNHTMVKYLKSDHFADKRGTIHE